MQIYLKAQADGCKYFEGWWKIC